MIDLIILVGGGCIITLLSAHTIKGCIDHRVMTHNLQKMSAENSKLTNSIANIHDENEHLIEVRTNLETTSVSLNNELDELKGVIDLCGENNANAYNHMIELYRQHQNTVDVDISTTALSIMMDLDKNSDFVFDVNERTYAIQKLRLLFSKKHVDILDADFDDLTRLQVKIKELIRNNKY